MTVSMMGTRNGNKFIYVYNIYCENVFFFKMGMLNLCIYCNESFIRVHDSPLQPSHPLPFRRSEHQTADLGHGRAGAAAVDGSMLDGWQGHTPRSKLYGRRVFGTCFLLPGVLSLAPDRISTLAA